MKIFPVEKIRLADEFTIKNEPITSIHLMERAALACVDWIIINCKNKKKFAVFCGKGNNGGDGFAIARILYTKGFDVDVFIEDVSVNFSENAKVNFNEIKHISGISIKNFKELGNVNLGSQTFIIDALFGTGLLRNLDAKHQELIKNLNVQDSLKISVDIPSGLSSDTVIAKNETVFQADFTLTFQFWKRSFLHPESGQFTGKVIVLDIKLSREFISNTSTDYFVMDDDMILDIFRPRKEFSHKGTYGKAMIVAGSYGKIGAAVLATKAALKTGSGLTFSLSPDCGYTILQSTCPEAMFVSGGEKFIDNIEKQDDVVYGIGPGLGKEISTKKALLNLLKSYDKELVLDADALNMISENPENIKLIPKNSVITPHPKEFERLFGATDNSFDRLELARIKASELQIYIVLKDHHTQIITPKKKVFYNITGNSGLAKGGSGDILTGIITSLLAQKYSPENAAVLGVWLHGKAADFAAEKYSKESMVASNVIEEIGNVFLYLNRKVTT